jgi:hypothetical protein
MDKIIRHLKKEYLLLKRNRNANYTTRKENLISIIGDECFRIIEAEISHVFLLQNCNGSIMKHLDFEPKITIESEELIAEKIQALQNLFGHSQDVIILPFDWEFYGGLVIKTKLFFDNFERIFYYLDDGVYIFDPKANKKIKLRGERHLSTEALNYLEIAG